MSASIGRVPGPALVVALNAVIQHASTDSTLPAINAVHFSAGGPDDEPGSLTLSATDRYTVGSYRLDWTGETGVHPVLPGVTPGGPVDVTLTLAGAKAVLATAKQAGNWPVELTFGPARLAVDAGPYGLNLDGVTCSFPRWAQLIPASGDNGVPSVLFDPKLLGRFSKGVAKGEYVRMSFDSRPNRAVLVEVGDRFRGLIMTRRDDRAVA